MRGRVWVVEREGWREQYTLLQKVAMNFKESAGRIWEGL